MSIDVCSRAVKVAAPRVMTVWYNFIRIHKTLRVTPAMEAGVTDRFFSDDEFVDIVDEWEASRKGSPGTLSVVLGLAKLTV